jgi:4-alpha-glucanotransferase
VLTELAGHFGISTEFIDWQGHRLEVSPETLVAVLAALDIDASTDESARAALERAATRAWRQVVPRTVVVRVGTPGEVLVHVPDGASVRVEAVLETGERLDLQQADHVVPPTTVDGVAIGEAKFLLPATIPSGWHELVATLDAAEVSTEAREVLDVIARRQRGATEPILEGRSTLIAAPDSSGFDVPEPTWGVMAQLYQARSEGSWGLGDLADLTTLGEWAAERDADFVLVNPFHAPSPVTPIEPSPYLPTTRRFLDPSLIHIEDLVAAEPVSQEVAQRLAQLAQFCRQNNDRDVLDRDGTWLAKREALGLCFEAARHGDEARWRAFGAFCEDEGEGLIDFATWAALCEQHGGNWRDWPEELRSPTSPAVDEFRQQHAARVEFYCWVQFVAREQGDEAQRRLRDAGMRIGVMHDLAVGVHPSGADAWALESLARGVSVGAPPDQYNQLGQNWSQPPLRPDALERLGYAPLRDVVRAAVAGAGALRIDHILGMFRQWWVPEGRDAVDGTYVTYNHEAMISVLLLEAERAGALVIGEDLGVVSDLTRETMRARHVYGTQIMWFEFEDDGTPKRPEHYREECLATVTTHDLPPTAGYLELRHVDIRDQLGLLTRPVEEERAAEAELVEAYREQLVAEGRVDNDADTDDLVVALHARLAGGRAKLFGVSLADLAGDRRPINQPGTFREYPNWTLPLADSHGSVLFLEQILRSELATRVADASQRGK